ncbi:hypothetical protein KP509_23G047000 [Ceratopteris richardii]|uniref:Uncharacterized protein n=1 Tax=Ceratopteris richardii TaxID=49495 RepID=A0A8T2S2K1_CERRI|nr:hypothetical protein KP509_23G047000 [Ceratopteris richardii]
MKHNVTAAMEDYEAKKPLLSEDGRFSLCVPSYFRRIMLIIGLHFRDIALVAGPLVFVVLLYTLDINGGESKSEDMVAVMAWMFIWWVFEAIPLAITALLPLFLLPLLRIQTASAVSKSYTSDSIFLIMGSFILANALQFRNLHKRFALYIISLFGSDPRFLLFGFCIGSGFISMWVDNVAAAAMLMPMAVAVQQKVHAGFDLQRAGLTDGLQAEADDSSVHEQESLGEDAGSKAIQKQSSMYPERHLSNVLVNMDAEDVLKIELDFSRGVAISVALSVTIGGMSTLTGNAANMVLSGIWEAEFPKEKSLSYLQWMLFTVPFAILLILTSWTLLCIFFCPPSAVKPICRSLHSLHFEDELAKLGAVTPDQIAVLVIYLVLPLQMGSKLAAFQI